jgi:hypothetical protein
VAVSGPSQRNDDLRPYGYHYTITGLEVSPVGLPKQARRKSLLVRTTDQDAIDLMMQVESLQRGILGIDHPDITASLETVESWLAADMGDSTGH